MTKNKQTPLALQLALTSHLAYRVGWQRQASAELRRLHDVNAELLEALRECADIVGARMQHSHELAAHMKACAAIAKATGEQ